MNTRVEFAVYNDKGVKICGSARTFTGQVTQSYAKREIARAHNVSPSQVEIKSMQQC